jgi:hypothetical protein
MPDLYLHPDGDALLVDPQGKLTADPACCCGYDAIVIELVMQATPGGFVTVREFTDAFPGWFNEKLFSSIRDVDANVFKHPGSFGPSWTSSGYATAQPACAILDSVPPHAPRPGARGLNIYIPVGPRVFRVVLWSFDLPFVAYVAAHIYTARIDLVTRVPVGIQTLACIENPSPVQISADQWAYNFPFTRP